MCAKSKRGQAGAKALKNASQQKVKENKKSLIKALKNFKEEKIPLVKTELAQAAGISIATLNRSPYKEIIREYMEDEKVLLSPKGKQEVAELIRENMRLKEKLEQLDEKYIRLKKEITYSRELFGG